MYQGSDYRQEDGARRRAFINECMRSKLQTQPYSSSTAMLATGKDDPTKAFTAAVPNGGTAAASTGGGFDFSSIPTSYLLIGAAAMAFFFFKKR